MPARIIVTLEGGAVQMVERVPEGVEVEVRDYDIEGVDETVLERDDSGDLYYSYLWP